MVVEPKTADLAFTEKIARAIFLVDKMTSLRYGSANILWTLRCGLRLDEGKLQSFATTLPDVSWKACLSG